jgi:hypothetical protein
MGIGIGIGFRGKLVIGIGTSLLLMSNYYLIKKKLEYCSESTFFGRICQKI